MQTEITNANSTSITQEYKEFSVFVGGLANTETNESLLNYFTIFGEIASCQVQVWKNHPQKCRGYAIVAAKNRETFERILNSSHKVGNRVVECKPLITDPETLNSHNEDVLKRKVFVSGLSKKLNDEQFREYFAQFGQISMAYIVKHHIDKKSRGFGFICFADSEAKRRLLEIKEVRMNGKVVNCADYLSRNTTKGITKVECDAEISDSKGATNQSFESPKKSHSPPTELNSQTFSDSTSQLSPTIIKRSKMSLVLATRSQFCEDESNLKFNRARVPIQSRLTSVCRSNHLRVLPQVCHKNFRF